MPAHRTSNVSKILVGSAKPSRLRDETQIGAPAGVPAPPPGETLSPEERIAFEWFVANATVPLGRADSALLVLLARTAVALRTAQAEVEREGAVVATATGTTKINPRVVVAQQLAALCLRLLGEVGLTPGGRVKLAAADPSAGKSDGASWDDIGD